MPAQCSLFFAPPNLTPRCTVHSARDEQEELGEGTLLEVPVAEEVDPAWGEAMAALEKLPGPSSGAIVTAATRALLAHQEAQRRRAVQLELLKSRRSGPWTPGMDKLARELVKAWLAERNDGDAPDWGSMVDPLKKQAEQDDSTVVVTRASISLHCVNVIFWDDEILEILKSRRIDSNSERSQKERVHAAEHRKTVALRKELAKELSRLKQQFREAKKAGKTEVELSLLQEKITEAQKAKNDCP